MRSALSWLLVLVALAWVAFVAREAMVGWPRVSLDMSPSDAGTRAALRNAELWHVLRHAALALIPAISLWLAAARLRRGYVPINQPCVSVDGPAALSPLRANPS